MHRSMTTLTEADVEAAALGVARRALPAGGPRAGHRPDAPGAERDDYGNGVASPSGQSSASSKGFSTVTPVGAKSRTLRVTTVKLRCRAMAAICRSELV